MYRDENGTPMHYAQWRSTGTLICGFWDAYKDAGKDRACDGVLTGPKLISGLRDGPKYKIRCPKCGITNYVED